VLGLVILALAILFIHPSAQLLPDGSAAPALKLRDATGLTLTVVPSPAHQPVVIEFFASNCVTCQQESGTLCRIAATNSAASVVAVNAGRETAATVAAYARRYSACAVPFLVDPGGGVSRNYEAAVVPTIYLIDRHGSIVYGGVGAPGIEYVSAHFAQLVGA